MRHQRPRGNHSLTVASRFRPLSRPIPCDNQWDCGYNRPHVGLAAEWRLPAAHLAWKHPMPYRSMSLEEFARHVGIDVRDVWRMADRGILPGQKIGGQWRFNRARVTEWLQQEMQTLDETRLIAVERAMSGSGKSGATGGSADETEMVVTDLIGLEGIDIALPARTRGSVLRELVNLAERTGLLYDAKGLLEAVEQRESLCSTALPIGVAIPHPRQPMPYVSAEPIICVARLPGGVVFGERSGELMRVFFLICCHTDHHHLHVLARLMRVLGGETVAQLLQAESREELLEVLIAKEAKVVDQMSKP